MLTPCSVSGGVATPSGTQAGGIRALDSVVALLDGTRQFHDDPTKPEKDGRRQAARTTMPKKAARRQNQRQFQ
jgi:hypothetical protein